MASVEGKHSNALREASLYGEWVVWWMGLGILSSVGLGSGTHSYTESVIVVLARENHVFFAFFEYHSEALLFE